MSQPIAFKTIRYRCPHCPRTGSSKARVTEHIGRCWHNPAARGCKTCAHYEPPWDDTCDGPCGACTGGPESCAVGVSLVGDDGAARLVVRCPQWALAEDEES